MRKATGRVRLVKAVDPNCRGISSAKPVLYTLSKRKIQTQCPQNAAPALYDDWGLMSTCPRRSRGALDPVQLSAADAGSDKAAGHLLPLCSLPWSHREADATCRVGFEVQHLLTRYAHSTHSY